MDELQPEIFNRDGLSALSIYELRGLARSLGVVSPTSKDKQEIVEEILQIIYGENYESLENLTKGRPVKNRRDTDWLGVFGTGDLEGNMYEKLDRNFMGSHSFVATPVEEYRNDANPSSNGKDFGVIVCENYQFYIKSFRGAGTHLAVKVPYELIEKNKLKAGDIVDYELKNGKVINIKLTENDE